ncbi:hypothetical protein RchiOBHm_Chr2g0096741 [Rosa chinensis]|uniref:Uncharacterized protein n=1 Tax=Rosa chinensis TaxID=74649 RepID=A0A2P6RL53_ROSCH|nr:hypothetical protein RchiOBHm_Chr2g0096741 [Rosa chinensis]
MGHMSYNRVGNVRANRGFRLNPRRFSVSRLRTRFLCFFKFLSRWRCSCMRRASTTSSNGSSSSRGLVRKKLQNKGSRVDCGRLRSYGRSNSFYAEAIADCLEFIKRSSISVDQKSKTTP